MKRDLNRRRLALLGVLLASQMLSACIIIPRPFVPRVIVVGAAAVGGEPSRVEYRAHPGSGRL